MVNWWRFWPLSAVEGENVSTQTANSVHWDLMADKVALEDANITELHVRGFGADGYGR